MLNFFKFFFIFFIVSETSLIFWFFFDNEITPHEYFLYEFFFVMYLNYYFNVNFVKNKLNIDILFKYFILLLKTPSLFFNYFINIFKKIFVFLYFYKYRHFINFVKITSKKILQKYFLVWRPLFKKTSYFGYYRSNRSKWIK